MSILWTPCRRDERLASPLSQSSIAASTVFFMTGRNSVVSSASRCRPSPCSILLSHSSTTRRSCHKEKVCGRSPLLRARTAWSGRDHHPPLINKLRHFQDRLPQVDRCVSTRHHGKWKKLRSQVREEERNVLRHRLVWKNPFPPEDHQGKNLESIAYCHFFFFQHVFIFL